MPRGARQALDAAFVPAVLKAPPKTDVPLYSAERSRLFTSEAGTPREQELRFDILRHGSGGYRKVNGQDGWRKSAVFGAAFRLTQTTDPLGEPAYALEVR